MNKIIFILPNIYESVNGVSIKYIKFINYLKKMSYNFVVFAPFKNNDIFKDLINNKFNIIKIKGLNIPFYNEIKIPIIDEHTLRKEINNGNEIIIFNGEFSWIYNTLKKIKKNYKNIKLYPTMHTDYLFYSDNFYKYYGVKSIFNFLENYLENKIFNGLIVTGERLKEKYETFTDSIFNANEIDLDLFNVVKKDTYDSDLYNIIYCGRISKEKNIEDLLDCCLHLNNKFDFRLNIIGDGPYLENLKNIIELEYKTIKSKIIFYGKKKQDEINTIYHKLENRIFIFTSLSETFGKTPMEACATGIPIFIKKSDTSKYLYINKKNAFIFNDVNEFLELFIYFVKLDNLEKNIFITDSVDNIQKYDQNIIFKDWIHFLLNGNTNNDKQKNKITILDLFTFNGISKFINCTGNILGD